MAVIGEDGSRLIVTLVNRSARDEALDLAVDLGELAVGPEAKLVRLAGESMYDQNTQEEPERIVPRVSTVPVENGEVRLSLRPYSLARLTFALGPS